MNSNFSLSSGRYVDMSIYVMRINLQWGYTDYMVLIMSPIILQWFSVPMVMISVHVKMKGLSCPAKWKNLMIMSSFGIWTFDVVKD